MGLSCMIWLMLLNVFVNCHIFYPYFKPLYHHPVYFKIPRHFKQVPKLHTVHKNIHLGDPQPGVGQQIPSEVETTRNNVQTNAHPDVQNSIVSIDLGNQGIPQGQGTSTVLDIPSNTEHIPNLHPINREVQRGDPQLGVEQRFSSGFETAGTSKVHDISLNTIAGSIKQKKEKIPQKHKHVYPKQDHKILRLKQGHIYPKNIYKSPMYGNIFRSPGYKRRKYGLFHLRHGFKSGKYGYGYPAHGLKLLNYGHPRLGHGYRPSKYLGHGYNPLTYRGYDYKPVKYGHAYPGRKQHKYGHAHPIHGYQFKKIHRVYFYPFKKRMIYQPYFDLKRYKIHTGIY